ncbi:uncharacterized protein LOC131431742 [Malaya genurostris]|uniref:uncharacterized protein LOC131431742 n=1 Tax=Malaya genurostris TaxID=325434 RepID=UPI0026F3B81C|nr:uncharacterized protein LOC131431742 [Malaya genurostris]
MRGEREFSNLRSLTLEYSPGWDMWFRLFGLTTTTTKPFAALTYLKLITQYRSAKNFFEDCCSYFFKNSTDLETVIIEDNFISGHIIEEINRLQKLKILVLRIHIVRSIPYGDGLRTPGLILPQLTSLTMVAESPIALYKVPNLKTLQLVHRRPLATYSYDYIATMFIVPRNLIVVELYSFIFSDLKLQKLILNAIKLESAFIDEICKLATLEEIQFYGVTMDQLEVPKILQSLTEIRQIEFIRCNLLTQKSPQDVDQIADFLEDKLVKNFIRNLRVRYSNCRIINRNSGCKLLAPKVG